MWKENNETMYNVHDNADVYHIRDDVLDDFVVDVNKIGFNDICKATNQLNPRTTEGGGYHPPVFFKRHIFSVHIFQKRFRTPLGYSLSHLLVNKFQKHFAPR